MPDDRHLQSHADQSRHHRPTNNGNGQGQAKLGKADGCVGPAHDEFTMRQVDDPHHPKDNGQPHRRDHQKGKGIPELIEERKQGR